jgi:hypothetical protein
VYLASQLHWSHQSIGIFFALWIIAYGMVQAYAPVLFSKSKTVSNDTSVVGSLVSGKLIAKWSSALAVCHFTVIS